ncbi:alpha-amylase [Escherichia marmotae]|uniref:Cytoplasmic alpha-amylase n=1 Tax=Escherichia marmotae TaxID=1499973 RepID=A0A2B7LYD9_9ESCH|nr:MULTISPECIES: alpha-amylase [Escherichia]EFB2834444.1 alpha-amylase [Escherichia coli]EFG0978768.1 alpha-amylase [Escherichia coli]EFG1109474.1 alpha-amylase [Escherichia coli]EFG1980960.1 alpha-amylase [Escherichia coli]EFG2025795.1 alpha-amylase [Escherichia coli]
MRNPTLLQCFHWYYPEGGKLWPELAERADGLNDIGINMIWLPPAYKGASGGYSVGYDSYDLFDLGEFDQKGSIPTKYGDKAQLLAAIDALKRNDIAVLLDVVVNHKMGADEKEAIRVQRVNADDRTQIDDEIIECEGWTRYTFPARAGQYSQFIWDFKCFSGIDHIENPNEDGIFKIVNDYTGEGWNDQVDDELGNFDYLMGENIDFRNHAVTEELKYWARWVMEQTQCDGFRLDAVKHIPAWFYKEWIEHVQEVAPKPLFIVAEYWSREVDKLQTYIAQVEGKTMLFDAPLQMKFHEASRMGRNYDMTQIFTGTLVEADPFHAVTLVANHDTQPLQALEAPVEPWFKPLAYALILLRENGVPSVFYPDLYGAHYEDVGGDGQTYPIDMPIIEQLDELILARQRFAHGVQTLFFDHPNCIAFSRSGTDEYPGCVVVMSNGDDGEKTIHLGENYGNKTWRDFLGNRQESVVTDENGEATFFCNGGSVSVWVIEEVI